MASPPVDNSNYVGVFMVEQPPDWWLPEGYSLSPTGAPPVLGQDPAGQNRMIYPVPDYRPRPERSESIADVIERELGPPQIGFTPETRATLGMDPNASLLDRIAFDNWGPVEAAVALLDLANYGIDATIVAGTESARRAGWMTETSAGRLRRDLMLMSIAAGAEAGRSPGPIAAEAGAAQLRVATMARAAASVLPPVVIRMEQATGVPFGRAFRVVGLLRTDMPFPRVQERTVDDWLARVRAGKKLELQQLDRYDFGQVYVVNNNGKGFRILDFYGPKNASFGAGPVSFKGTQLADIKVRSATAALQEAYRNFRPGTVIADVPSRPERLVERTLSGQLWLEVPVQSKPVPLEILATAKRLSIRIRDVTGKIYE